MTGARYYTWGAACDARIRGADRSFAVQQKPPLSYLGIHVERSDLMDSEGTTDLRAGRIETPW
jgi:hypothetical protein